MDAREHMARQVRQWLLDSPERVSGVAALRLCIDLLGDRATLCPADQYIYLYARSQGYYLPPYPLAGCGEIREFLADEGASDVPGWYERIGVSRQLYEKLFRYELLVLRDDRFWKQALPIDCMWWKRAEQEGRVDKEAYELALYTVAFVYGDERAVRTVIFR